MKIVYMGTPDFAVGPLRAMIEAGYEVTAVVTQPDKPKGRSGQLIPTPVKSCALEYGIPVLQPTKIKTPDAIDSLRQYEADIFVVAAFGQILSGEILEMPRLGCINIHASLLPKYRGAAPIQWAIIDGEKETGVTIQQMDIGVDTGDILAQKIVPITDEDTGESLFDKLCVAGSSLLIETLPKLQAGEITPVPQDEKLATHAKMLTKELGNIDFSASAEKIAYLVRGLNSWPSAYTYYEGKMMKIWKAKAVEGTGRQCEAQTCQDAESPAGMSGKPGQITAVHKDSIDVSCGEGTLRIYEIQMEGKKRMSVKDFMLGHAFAEGVCFTRSKEA